jgi:hypothetical protein
MLATEDEAAILTRVLQPRKASMTPEVAREILRLGFEEADHARMQALSSQAQEGTLTTDERQELEAYVNVSHFLALLHSKARIALNDNGPGTSAA